MLPLWYLPLCFFFCYSCSVSRKWYCIIVTNCVVVVAVCVMIRDGGEGAKWVLVWPGWCWRQGGGHTLPPPWRLITMFPLHAYGDPHPTCPPLLRLPLPLPAPCLRSSPQFMAARVADVHLHHMHPLAGSTEPTTSVTFPSILGKLFPVSMFCFFIMASRNSLGTNGLDTYSYIS